MAREIDGIVVTPRPWNEWQAQVEGLTVYLTQAEGGSWAADWQAPNGSWHMTDDYYAMGDALRAARSIIGHTS